MRVNLEILLSSADISLVNYIQITDFLLDADEVLTLDLIRSEGDEAGVVKPTQLKVKNQTVEFNPDGITTALGLDGRELTFTFYNRIPLRASDVLGFGQPTPD